MTDRNSTARHGRIAPAAGTATLTATRHADANGSERWRVRLTVARNGIARDVYGLSQAEALSKATAALFDTRIAKGTPTVAAWCATWLTSRQSTAKKVSTYVRDEVDLRLYIVPTIGTVRLDRLTPEHLRDLNRTLSETESALTGRKLSGTYQYNIVKSLRNVLHAAEERWVIDPRCFAKSLLPAKDTAERNPLTDAEYAEVLAAINDPVRLATVPHGARFHAAFLIALELGARSGEILALRWSDIDRTAGSFSICGAVTRGAHGTVIGDTKTAAARRTLPLGDNIAAALDRLPRRGSLVFPSINDPERPTNQGEVLSAWHALLRVAGVRAVRFHDARHFAATELIHAGVPIAEVSGLLGHANVAITLKTYTHAVKDFTATRAVLLARSQRLTVVSAVA